MGLVVASIAMAACGTTAPPRAATILLFNGTGVSPRDVEAVEAILSSNRLSYSMATSRQLNRMGEAQIRQFRLLIVPGGNFVEMGKSLTPAATSHIRNAVQGGMNYLGICAGGFLAGKYNPPYNGLNLAAGARFGFYAEEARGTRKAAVPIAIPGAPTLDQYWEDGPEFTGWGDVVGRYPNGTPAIVEGAFGSGWIVLSGVHPEAPESWRRGISFHTPAAVDHAYAGALIAAALSRTPLAR